MEDCIHEFKTEAGYIAFPCFKELVHGEAPFAYHICVSYVCNKCGEVKFKKTNLNITNANNTQNNTQAP